MESGLVQTPSGPVEYTRMGEGPLVLVCHGTSSDCNSTHTSLPWVEAGFQVLTPSRPGYGRTPLSAGRTANEAADALAGLLQTLAIPACQVVAISGGGPTGIAFAARHVSQVMRLVLLEAISHPEDRPNEPGYHSQVAFYGPMHALFWGMLHLLGRMSPRSTARRTLSIFSTHDPDDIMRQLTDEDIRQTCAFFLGRSSRKGALNDLTHTVGADLLQAVSQPTLVVHSREDRAVLFGHAEWVIAHIEHADLCESGLTGHFYWIGPDSARVNRRIISFLKGHSS
jgi:pimeloyl-ACP methyl ester carboxylesterase